MNRELCGRLGAHLLTVAAFAVWQPVAPAIARGAGQSSGGAFNLNAQPARAPEFSADSWTLHDNGQLALVGAAAGDRGVFAGIQCDPYEPRSHRLMVGAVHRARPTGLGDVLRNQSARFLITTDSPSLATRFEVSPEDRGHSSFGGASDYAAAYLTQQQFDAINIARSFVISIGTRNYNFNGNASKRTIGALACHSSAVHIASRVIERSRQDIPTQKLTSWRLAVPSGRTAFIDGKAEAYALTTDHPANPDANFTLGVACSNRNLFVHFEVALKAGSVKAAQIATTNAFIQDFSQHAKLLEVYRGGQRLTTMLVEGDDHRGQAHALSERDLASLKQADSLAIVGDNKVIEFSIANAAQTLSGVSQSCRRND